MRRKAKGKAVEGEEEENDEMDDAEPEGVPPFTSQPTCRR